MSARDGTATRKQLGGIRWDTDTAVALLVLLALGFLVAVRVGFGPVRIVTGG